MGDRRLGKRDVLNDVVGVYSRMAPYHVKNRLSMFIVDGSKKYLPFFRTRARFHNFLYRKLSI